MKGLGRAQCINKAYLDEIKKMRASGSNEVLESLPWKKQGRPLLLGDKINGMVQSYIRRIREEGAGVSTQILLGAARGILKTIDLVSVDSGHFLFCTT